VIRFLCENLVQGILKTSINLVGIFNLVMIIRCTETGEIGDICGKLCTVHRNWLQRCLDSEYCVSIDKVCKREQALILAERLVAYF